MSGLNTFDRGCYGWHCDNIDDCKHHRTDAQTMAQFFFRVIHDDICPFYESKLDPRDPPWGAGPEAND